MFDIFCDEPQCEDEERRESVSELKTGVSPPHAADIPRFCKIFT